MEFTVENIIKLQQLAKMLDVRSLNEIIKPDADKEGDAELGDIIESDQPSPQEILEKKELQEILMKAMQQLPPRQQQVLILRFGLYDRQPKTLDEVGQIYGVTRERVRQIEAKALERLRWLLICKYKIKEYDI